MHDGNKLTPILEPQKDPKGLWTLGWGSRYDKNFNEVNANTPAITLAEADFLLSRDISRFSQVVNNACYNINQNQFDALVSFCYNLGNINGLIVKVNNGTLTRNDFLLYVYAGGQRLQGLVNRRNLEADLYFTKETPIMLIKRIVKMFIK